MVKPGKVYIPVQEFSTSSSFSGELGAAAFIQQDSTGMPVYEDPTSTTPEESSAYDHSVDLPPAFKLLEDLGNLLAKPIVPAVLMQMMQSEEMWLFNAVAAGVSGVTRKRKPRYRMTETRASQTSAAFPIVIGIYQSGTKSDAHKKIIKDAFDRGARSIGLEMTEERFDSGYFTQLAEYAGSLGMTVVPLIDRNTYVDMLAVNTAVSLTGMGGIFEADRYNAIKQKVEEWISDGETAIVDGSSTPDSSELLAFYLKRIEILDRAKEIVNSAGGDLSALAKAWIELGKERPAQAISAAIAERRPDISIVRESYAKAIEGTLGESRNRYPDKEFHYARAALSDPLFGEFLDTISLIGRMGDMRDSSKAASSVFVLLFMLFLQERGVIDRKLSSNDFLNEFKKRPADLLAYAASFRSVLESSPGAVHYAMWVISEHHKDILRYFSPVHILQMYRSTYQEALKKLREMLRPREDVPFASERTPAKVFVEAPIETHVETPTVAAVPDEADFRATYKGLTEPERIERATHGSVEELMGLCSDPSPVVIRKIIDNTKFSPVLARLIAEHHHTAIGLNMLAGRAGVIGDKIVQERLLKNSITPQDVLARIFRSMSIGEIFNVLNGSDATENAKAVARTIFREKFRNASMAEEWIRYIIANEGRCLRFLYGEKITKPMVDEFLAHNVDITLVLIRNMSSFPGLPRAIIVHILGLRVLQQSSELRRIMHSKITAAKPYDRPNEK